MSSIFSLNHWSRIVLTWIEPSIDGGRWPIKRVLGEEVEVTAGLILDGHDHIEAALCYKKEDGPEQAVRMKLRHNDEYYASFLVSELGRYQYFVRAWIDHFGTWQEQFRRRVEGGDSEYEINSELKVGASILKRSADNAESKARENLLFFARSLEEGDLSSALSSDVLALARVHETRDSMVESDAYYVQVDTPLARFAAWYEFFPRSVGESTDPHATLTEAADLLPRIKKMGFDIVYLPPVHPIGITHRKGKDNAPVAKEGEPGSPWAIGSDEGGHKSIHADLGGLPAFDQFLSKANDLDLKVALDIAFQTSPDHPYVKEHPDWFLQRPDGSIRYAENPPKKYQDIYPFNFEAGDWKNLWTELKSIFEFWIDRGVTVFRVDNPHTKPFAFWEWCLNDLRSAHPDLIFLAEAFSRPKIMYTLAKLGFNNSYTYFTWRNTKTDLEEYCHELFQTDVAEFFRPNFWPNTPDILHDYLVHGGRPAHVIRLVLAATLSSAYGLYGPPFEHINNEPHPHREEYTNSEKYEIRTWNWDDPHSLQSTITRINRIRRENPALHEMRNLRFHHTDNPYILAYSKQTANNLILVVVNLDPFQTQQGWLQLPLNQFGIVHDRPYQVHDLYGGEHYFWQGEHNYVRLDPWITPVHVFRVYHHVRTEHDFPYYT